MTYTSYFEKYKIYYDSLKDNQSIIDKSASLASDCSDELFSIKNSFFNSITECKWKENGKDIIISDILPEFDNELSRLIKLINSNLQYACQMSINCLLPQLEDIKGYDEDLKIKIDEYNENLQILKEYQNTLLTIPKKIVKSEVSIIKGKKSYSSWEEDNPEYAKYCDLVNSQSAKVQEIVDRITFIKDELFNLCGGADYLIKTIKQLNFMEELPSDLPPIFSDININVFNYDTIVYFNMHPEIRDLFMYYCPLLQEKLMIGSQEAYQMMMDAYDDPSVIQRYGTFDALLNAIVTNCPVTYLDYNFNPVAFNPYKDSSGLLTIIGPYNNAREYELSPNYMEKYVAYYEEFNIDGNLVKIVQTFPKEALRMYGDKTTITPLEKHFYDIYKANCINFIKYRIPSEVLDVITSDGDLKIIIPYDKECTLRNDPSWAGYYRSGRVVLDPKGSLHNNNFYVNSVLSHEIGHNFDDAYDNQNLYFKFYKLFLGNENLQFTSSSATRLDSRFYDFAQKYAVEIDSIEGSGYSVDDLKRNITEFYACAFESYINKPNELQTLCPEVYDAIEQMMGGTW